MLSLYTFGNSSPILTNPEVINDTKTDPIGDANNAFVDIVNTTVSRNETSYYFSVFTLEEVPTDIFLTEEDSLHDIQYSVRLFLWMNNIEHTIHLQWFNQSWKANAYFWNSSQGQQWWNILEVFHISNQFSFYVPVSFLGKSTPIEWYSLSEYYISYQGSGYESDYDICPDSAEKEFAFQFEYHHDLVRTRVAPENTEFDFLDKILMSDIFGMPLIIWLCALGLIVIFIVMFKEGLVL